MFDNEVKQNPALVALLGEGSEGETEPKATEPKQHIKKNPKKVNPKGYVRNRGKGGTKPMSYYLPEEIISLLNIKAAQGGKTKSELVLEGLRYVLRDELKEKKKEEQ